MISSGISPDRSRNRRIRVAAALGVCGVVVSATAWVALAAAPKPTGEREAARDVAPGGVSQPVPAAVAAEQDLAAAKIETDRRMAGLAPDSGSTAAVVERPAIGFPTSAGQAAVEEIVIDAVPVDVELLEQPPGMTAAIQEMIEQARMQIRAPVPAVPITGSPEAAVPVGPPTEATLEPSETGGVAAAPGDFRFFVNAPVTPAGQATSSVTEPSVANNDRIVFQSGNWYAAISEDDGQTWTHVNPATSFSSVNGGFCCDQIVMYEPSRDILIWLLQYSRDANSGSQRLAIANGVADLENLSWCTYTYNPQMLGFGNGNWLDFPDMSVGTNFLYTTTNVFSTTCPGNPPNCPWTGTVIVRWPLDSLRDCAPAAIGFFNQLGLAASERRFAFRTAQGIGTTAFFAAHNSTSSLRIYNWPEGGNVGWNNVNHDAFSWDGNNMTCPGPDGNDACGRADTRVLGAYRANGELGFMWNSSRHGGFPFPYTRIAVFRESDRALLMNSTVWSGNGAWIYPSVGVNSRGDVAGTIFFTGGASHPLALAWINDDLTAAGSQDFAPLENYFIRGSTNGPNGGRWGDYLAARRHSRFGTTWIGSAFTLQGGPTNANSEPRHVWFGRERDLPPPRPSNDDCTSARVIPAAQWNPALMDTVAATKSGDDPFQACSFGGAKRNSNTVWFRYTPPCTGTFDIDTLGSNYDTVLSVHRGNCGAFVEIACSDDANATQQSQVTGVPVSGGLTYYIEVSDWNLPGGGDLDFNFSFTPTHPCNDLCVNAQSLRLPASIVGTTVGATVDTAPACGAAGAPSSPGVWYSVVGNGETFTASTCSDLGDFDTQISVFCGDCAQPFCAAGNDNDGRCLISDLLSRASWCTERGRKYLILVHSGGRDPSGRFELSVAASGNACTNPPLCTTPTGACCAPVSCLDGGNCDTGFSACGGSFNCLCFQTSTGPTCHTPLSCVGLTPCPNGASDCPTGQDCFVNTCCGGPVCAVSQCNPLESAVALASEGAATMASDFFGQIAAGEPGQCQQVTKDECDAMGGVYSGNNTSCTGVTCPGPIGACCVQGDCIGETQQATCAARGGTWFQDRKCTGITCPLPRIACCLPDDRCIDTSAAKCLDNGGRPQGLGSSCANLTCTPDEACCGPNGECVETPRAACIERGGTPLGPNTHCLGDGNQNRVDDACEPTGTCDGCGGVPHWVDGCKTGADNIPTGALVGIDTDLDCVADRSFVLSGPTTVNRSDPRDDSFQFPGLRTVDQHRDVLDTEIMSLVLQNPSLGVTLRAGRGMGVNPIRASFGAIAETTNDPLLADSFFDVFAEVDLGGRLLYNLEPLQVQAQIDCLPPLTTYIHRIGCIKLYDSPVPGQGNHVANLVNAEHGTYPTCGSPVAGDCFEPNGTPFCNDGKCCDRVCSQLPRCCQEAWDGLCAEIASALCTPPDRTPPDCAATAFDPPSTQLIGVQDTESGVCQIVVDVASNVDVTVPAFAPGTTTPITVVVTRLDNAQDALVALTITDCAGNVTHCSHGWPQACCLPGGECRFASPDDCRGAGGVPGGPGSGCQGDQNQNGVDDACELNQPCDQCGQGPHWVDRCSGGTDNVPSGAVLGLDVDLDCAVDTNLVMSGPVRIRRAAADDDSVNFPGLSPIDGHFDVIDTEMVALDLTGGGVGLVAGAGRGVTGNLAASFGAIAETDGDPSLADSFFDVFFEVRLGAGLYAYNHEPLRVKSTIDCVPPDQNYFHPEGCVDLYDSPFPGQGRVVARLVTANHSTFPGCGDPGTGDCREKHDSPFCNDAECCSTVCANPDLAYCCTQVWDALCAGVATKFCLPPEGCCLPDGTCQDIRRQACVEQGGTPQGPGTSCATVLCEQPLVACCLPEGGCVQVPHQQCRLSDGAPAGPGSTCTGDNNGNGRDDACELNEPCDECGPGPHWVDACPAGVDNMPSQALAGLDRDGDCVADLNLILSGPVTVQRGPGSPHAIGTEITAMTLTDGAVTLRAGAGGGAGGALQRSLGRIIEQSGDPALADSFFDVFFEVSGGGLPGPLYNHTALRVQANIDCLPPQTTYIHVVDCIDLFDSPVIGQGNLVARLVAPQHQTYPTEACCGPEGGCQDLTPERCRQLGGSPGGPGSACQGDNNGNGRDDACELDEPCSQCGPGPHWVDGCPAGTDQMPSQALTGLDRDGDCIADANFILSGPVTVQRQAGFPHAIRTEITAMTLTDGALTLRAGGGGGLRRSFGAIIEQPADPALADSFFDVFFEVTGAGLPGPLYNHTALRVQAKIDCLPPQTTYIHVVDCIDLFDSPVIGQGNLVARLVAPQHQTYPTEACCGPEGGCQNLPPERCRQQNGAPGGPGSACQGDNDGNGRDDACERDEPCGDCGPGPHWVDTCPAGVDNMPTQALTGLDRDGDCVADANFILSGPVTVQRQAGFPHAIRTEITAMTLTDGALNLRAGGGGGLRRSFGAIIEQPADPALADSFFDVFFEVTGAGLPGPLYNHTPLRVQAKIDCLPPQTTYIHVVDCIELFDSPVIGQGNLVARLVAPQHQTYPTEACCGPEGGCQDLPAERCRQQNGAPGGPGSACQGDNNGNGRDDACELDEPCSQCGPGPHWVDTCPAGTDEMPSQALTGIDRDGDCIADANFILSGPVTVQRHAGFPHAIRTEITAMTLTDGALTLRAGGGGGLRPSLGAIIEQPADPALADSFFDVFFEVTGAGLPGPLFNHTPLRVQAKIDCLPPQTTYIHVVDCIDLFDSPVIGQGNLVAKLVAPQHQTYPTESCCGPEGGCQDLTPERCRQLNGSPGGPGSACQGDNNGNGRDDACEVDQPCAECGPGPHWVDTCPAGTDEMPSQALTGIDRDGDCIADANFILSGPVTVQRHAGFPHAIRTEITAMTLTDGALTLRAGGGGGLRPSLGAIIEQPADPALADSFFDVFFEVTGAGLPGPLYNHTALRIQAKIDCLPPQTTYIHVVDCIELFDSPVIGQGNLVARLVAPQHQTYPTEACCHRQATGAPACADLTVEQCLARDGVPQGEGTRCLGDNNNNGVDDACEPPVAHLVRSDPACGVSWPRSRNNFMKMEFDRDLTPPLAGQVQIRELLAGGAFGADLSANFTFAIINDGSGNPRVLRIDEIGGVLTDRRWYAVTRNGWAGVADFEVDIPHLIGDADGNGRTLSADVVAINLAISPLVKVDDRRDIDGNGRILSADVVLANSKISPLSVPKPTGHACNP